MKTTNHTPGPWKHDENWGLIKYGKTEICALHSSNESNAHLIAAAPEMLAILKRWAIRIDDSCEDSFTIDRIMTVAEAKEINTAIAKAEGVA